MGTSSRAKRSGLPHREELLGFNIVMKGGQITRVNDKLFLVNSQSNAPTSKITYKVKWKKGKWICGCRSFAEREKRACKHIHGVNILLKFPQIMMANLEALEGVCPECGSNEIIMKGFRYNKSGAVRKYCCNYCGSWFKNPVSHEDISSNIALYIIVVDLFFKKLSLREIQNHLYQIYGIQKGVTTLHTWILKFIDLIKKVVKEVKFDSGKMWLADEMVIKVNGKRMYLWNILDHKSRYHIISRLTTGRGTEEAEEVIASAIKKMGKRPNKVVTDGLASYCVPLAKYGIHHVSNIGIANKDATNNRAERLHNTIRGFVRAKRGMKGRAKELLEGHNIYYNCVRPNMALGGKVPHTVAKDKKWISLASMGTRKRRK